jgi:aminoacylase
MDMGLPFKVVKMEDGSNMQTVVITYKNLLEDYKDNTESIMMNSHMDIVPADPVRWNTDPFKPETTSDGKIYARGSQDMKSVGMQYLEAVNRLKQRNVKLRYTIHLTFVPDEEVGGTKGMEAFLKTKEFKEMNVIFSYDEGIPAIDRNMLNIYYGENIAWWFRVTCEGNVGHGSQFIKNTASSQLYKYMKKAFEFRESQEQLITLSDQASDESDVVTINMNAMEGGYTASINVVPRQVHGYFDSRIPPHYNLIEMKRLYTEEWTKGTNCTIHWIQNGMKNPTSDLNFPIIQKTISYFMTKYENVKLKYFPAATDARYVRLIGIPCLGVSLLSGVPMLLHDHNEYITEEIFLRGITQYQELLVYLSEK